MEWDRATSSESAWGTSAPARFWLAVEQNGPWGRTAATQSYFPNALGDRLTRGCREAGGRLTMIRRPGSHADPRSGPRRVYVAWSGPGSVLLTGRVESPDELTRIPLWALGRGDVDAVRAALPQLQPSAPVMLVCTNGRHDVCCAIRGRPVAVEGHARFPGRVWECSHTGGHRFSPTGVLLPWGRALARMDRVTVGEVLEAAESGELPFGMLGPRHDRGASGLAPQVQVGESAVRDLLGETDLEALTAVGEGPLRIRVSHRDGRAWMAELSVVEGEARRNSCGDAALPARTWTAQVSGA